MAKQEFLDNFRTARNLFVHAGARADDPQLDPQSVAQRQAQAAIWLTPKSVQGFDADDFPELGADRQSGLKAAVREFSEVASQVPPTEPPTPEQLTRATAAFTKMLVILERYVPTPQEGDRVRDAIRAVAFPPWVANWDYELVSDSDGEPAVWVTLFADERTMPRPELGRLVTQLDGTIHSTLSAAGIERWPYLRVRTAAEHKKA